MNGPRSTPRARGTAAGSRLGRLAGAVILVMSSYLPATAQAGAGRIIGRVVDAQTGAPLPAVQVTIPSLSRVTLSDADGRYVLLNVPAGSHSITARSLGYGEKTVTGVAVDGGRAASIAISLVPQAVALEGITVSAERERGSTTTLISERRSASVVSDAIGAEQISRAPDGDVAAALRRVPGVTVVDGRYVYIRGLGERYGATTLNGAPMPSPLPDRKAVPLDVIPSDLLESVVTSKSYLPSQPGDYAGGLVQIRTRDVPTSRIFQISASAGYDATTSFQPTLGFGQGGLLAGIGEESARLPASVFTDERVSLPANEPARAAMALALTDRFGPPTVERPLNRSYGITFGDQVDLIGRSLGIIATVTGSESYSTPASAVERLYVAAGDEPRQDYDFAVAGGTSETGLGALASASIELAPAQRLTAVGNFNRLTEDQSRLFSGLYSGGDYFETFNTRYVASSIANAQLRGDHVVAPLGGSVFKWRASAGRAARDEPGTRTVAYRGTAPGGVVYFQPSQSSGVVLAQQLDENVYSAAADLELPFGSSSRASSISVGISTDRRDRDVETRRILLTPVDDVSAVSHLPPEQLFVPERIGTGSGQLTVVDRTFAADNYLADQTIDAGYASIDAEVLPRLRVAGGVRLERAMQNVAVTGFRSGEQSDIPPTRLDDVDLIPAVNLTYALTGAANLRLAGSRTLARPQFRELSPFLYADYFGDVPIRGNPFLVRSRVLNIDARWEWFAAPGAVVSLGAFHKQFDNPIEPIAIMLGTNPGRTFANTESATVTGAELEMRAPVGPLTMNANVTLARSAVHGEQVAIYDPQSAEPLEYPVSRGGGRPLFGQSPYALNLGATYFNDRSGTSATLLFNRFGRRVDTTGGVQLPDIYEEGRSQLDLTIEQALAGGVALKLAAARLLGGGVRFTQTFLNGDTVTTRSYELGRTFSMSLSWRP